MKGSWEGGALGRPQKGEGIQAGKAKDNHVRYLISYLKIMPSVIATDTVRPDKFKVRGSSL
jgi:hypothetical protein